MDFNRIEILRKELKLTQEEIARDAGISTAGYQQMIYKKNTTVSTLEKISKALKVSPAFWWSEETEMKNGQSRNEPHSTALRGHFQGLTDAPAVRPWDGWRPCGP